MNTAHHFEVVVILSHFFKRKKRAVCFQRNGLHEFFSFYHNLFKYLTDIEYHIFIMDIQINRAVDRKQVYFISCCDIIWKNQVIRALITETGIPLPIMSSPKFKYYKALTYSYTS